MQNQIASFLSQGVTSCIVWLDDLLMEIQAWDLIFGMFVLSMAVRFLLAPILGSATPFGSDTARKEIPKGKGKDE